MRSNLGDEEASYTITEDILVTPLKFDKIIINYRSRTIHTHVFDLKIFWNTNNEEAKNLNIRLNGCWKLMERL